MRGGNSAWQEEQDRRSFVRGPDGRMSGIQCGSGRPLCARLTARTDDSALRETQSLRSRGGWPQSQREGLEEPFGSHETVKERYRQEPHA